MLQKTVLLARILRGWEERVISQKRGIRIIHFTLRGSCLLVVVEVERGINHMIYPSNGDYLRSLESTSRVHAGTRWKSGENAIKFLMSVTSGGSLISADSSMYLAL